MVDRGQIILGTVQKSTDIFDAIIRGQIRSVSVNLERRPALLFQRDHLMMTPLHFAANHGRIDIAQLLVVKGAEVNAKALNLSTPLHHAAEHGFRNIVYFLLANGANINDQTARGDTALHMATMFGHVETVKLLLQLGANRHLPNIYNDTPLRAAVNAKQYNIVEMLNLWE